MKELYIDLETVPTQREDIKTGLALNIKPPAKMTKAETTEKWHKEQKSLEVDKAYRKTSLNGTLGEIICIGYAIDDIPAKVIGRTLNQLEQNVLIDFFDAIHNIHEETLIIGHCVANFDLKFLYQRAVVNNIKPPSNFPARDVKAWSKNIFDTNEQWVGKSSASGSLDAICRSLGIKAKGELDGSKVWDYIKEGRYEEVFKYCGEDVERTRELYKRMNFI